MEKALKMEKLPTFLKGTTFIAGAIEVIPEVERRSKEPSSNAKSLPLALYSMMAPKFILFESDTPVKASKVEVKKFWRIPSSEAKVLSV